MAKNKQLSRLLQIILLVQSRPDWRPKKLAQHFGVSETRIYQDIREITAAGIPIAFSGSGYQVTSGLSFSPTLLTAEGPSNYTTRAT